MMLEMAAALTVASVATEMMVVAKIPFLRTLLQKHALTSLAFSLALSWVIGTVFGAIGMIIMIAGLCSSIVSWLIYRVLNFFSGSRKALVA